MVQKRSLGTVPLRILAIPPPPGDQRVEYQRSKHHPERFKSQ
jgi:hypothetical protein